MEVNQLSDGTSSLGLTFRWFNSWRASGAEILKGVCWNHLAALEAMARYQNTKYRLMRVDLVIVCVFIAGMQMGRYLQAPFVPNLSLTLDPQYSI
jgi:hypothetical protein